MARRRRRATTKRRATTRRRRRPVTARRRPARRRRVTRRRQTVTVGGRVYRNPSVVGMAMQGVKDALAVTGGRVVSGFVVSKLPTVIAGQAGQAVNQFAAAILVGMVSRRFLGADVARFATAGALSGLVETGLRMANIPALNAALSPGIAGYPQLRGYPQGISGYPRALPALSGLAGDPGVIVDTSMGVPGFGV